MILRDKILLGVGGTALSAAVTCTYSETLKTQLPALIPLLCSCVFGASVFGSSVFIAPKPTSIPTVSEAATLVLALLQPTHINKWQRLNMAQVKLDNPTTSTTILITYDSHGYCVVTYRLDYTVGDKNLTLTKHEKKLIDAACRLIPALPPPPDTTVKDIKTVARAVGINLHTDDPHYA